MNSEFRGCSVDGCPNRHRARGLCVTHYNQRHDKSRGVKVETPCHYCGAVTLKQWRTDRRFFCSYTCRDLWALESGDLDRRLAAAHTARWRRCAVPKDHPARWIGDSTPVPWGACADCGAVIVQRGPRLLCARCAKRRNYVRRYARRSSRWAGRRTEIFQRDDWICWLCGERTDPNKRVPHPLSATLDHVLPVAHGGDDEDGNLACAHFICNSTRGDSLVTLTLAAPAHAA